MKKTIKSCIYVAISAVLLSACAGGGPFGFGSSAPESPLLPINHQTFADEITSYEGSAIVLFYNTQYWQSLDMKRRMEWLAEKYPKKAKFAMFHWQVSDDTSRFNLEMLPTVILYRNGAEIDRIKGIPPNEKDRVKWNDDLELWFLKNALGLEDSEYSGEFTYFFRNGYKLDVGNY
ncbi:MAG: thioredoxin domain-containing protein [Desulfosalsimonadaceae bacterium]